MGVFTALKNKRARVELLKSMAVGIVSTILDFFVMALILYIAASDIYANVIDVFLSKTISGLPYSPPISIYMTSIVISFTISFTFNYIMCVFFVYDYGNVGKNKKGFLKFAIFALIGLAITSIGSLIGFAGLHGNVWWIKIVITIIVFVFNFFTRKFFVFNLELIRDDENTIKL